MRKFLGKARRKLCKKFISENQDDLYCTSLPSNQTAVDIFKNRWFSAFPPQYHVRAGDVAHFDFSVDPRVQWVDEQLRRETGPNGLKGFKVLELGPYEAYNTWQLDQLGAGPITAVENNKISYLKCLVVKEITGLNARFLHGDFVAYLEQCAEQHAETNGAAFDIVWASGVLYHQVEPLKLLSLIAAVTDKVFIHTHYFHREMIDRHPDLGTYFDPRRNLTQTLGEREITLHYRSYRGTNSGDVFSGGARDHCYWLDKKDIFAVLEQLGFGRITVEVDAPDHVNGPGICFLAEK